MTTLERQDRRDLRARARALAVDAARQIAAAGREASRVGQATFERTRAITTQTLRVFRESAGPELQAALLRLRKIRKPRDALDLVPEEVEHLLAVVVPVLIDNPLPVRSPQSARLVVGSAAAAAATAEEAEELALVFTSGASAPGLPTIVVTALGALYLEAHDAVTLRVHALKEAGLPVEPEAVARDVAAAMIGSRQPGQRIAIQVVAKQIAKRFTRRWVRGLVPVLGIAYSAWDAQSTIANIAAMPLTPTEPVPSTSTPPTALGPGTPSERE